MPQKRLQLRLDEQVLDMILSPMSQRVSMQASNKSRGLMVDVCSGPIHTVMDMLPELSINLTLRPD